jgi:hypothetical protein
VDHVEKYKLPKHLLEKEEAIRTNPGHAYEGLELASDYRLDQGQDLFARPKEEPPKEPSKQEQKESKRKRREEKEDKRREKEERRRAREERKREKRAKVYRETSDSDEPRQKKHYRNR